MDAVRLVGVTLHGLILMIDLLVGKTKSGFETGFVITSAWTCYHVAFVFFFRFVAL